ncbi:glycosyltransferase family 2 protein [Virgisporangium ochraceum]|uniref:Glycosyl transferase family 2 n=1 Tax=Virgisporangium ochraceum TaxID=65505 RepID=A0A8J4E8H6_9ACTN|nr:glycosyltransferase family 2 protein [Virgisporangium ochraceum]GIJ65681.1 glycosyl transferase family 2 [Virgisporangium ochraceum]
MTGEPETIAVVVVTYNSASLIEDLVASLAPGLRGLNWHLTVADNDSRDGTVEAVRRFAPFAHVVETGRNAGYAAGINAAVAAAKPFSAVLVLNPDIRLGGDCVPELLKLLRERGAGIAVPKIVRANGDFSPSLRREPTILRAFGDALGATRMGRYRLFGESVTNPASYADEVTVDWAEGSIMLIDKPCWDACGGWDETFFLYAEETEYALRARDHGFAMMYTPHANARHLEGDAATNPPLWALLTLNRIRLYRRRHNAVSTAVYWAMVLLREASRAALGNPSSRRATKALLSARRLRERPGPLSIAPAA